MVVPMYNVKGKKVGEVELRSDIFEAPVNVSLMHQALVRQMANARLGTHKTKTRNEVSGGGRKPWRQKGTGRARQGSIRAAQWVGGGKIHTPRPRDYSQKMPRKMRRAALCSALSVKASENSIVLLEELTLPEVKTRDMSNALDKLVGDRSALVLIPMKSASYDVVVLSTRNLPDAKTVMADYLNMRDLLSYDTILMPVEALDVLKKHLG